MRVHSDSSMASPSNSAPIDRALASRKHLRHSSPEADRLQNIALATALPTLQPHSVRFSRERPALMEMRRCTLPRALTFTARGFVPSSFTLDGYGVGAGPGVAISIWARCKTKALAPRTYHLRSTRTHP